MPGRYCVVDSKRFLTSVIDLRRQSQNPVRVYSGRRGRDRWFWIGIQNCLGRWINSPGRNLLAAELEACHRIKYTRASLGEVAASFAKRRHGHKALRGASDDPTPLL